VTVDAKLKAALEKKLGVSERHVNRLITERAQAWSLPREQAAIAIAQESGVNTTRFASQDDLAAIRQVKAASGNSYVQAPAAAAMPTPARTPQQRRREAPPRTRVSRKILGKKVWVVYGRNDQLRRELFRFLRALGLSPVEFSSAIRDTKKASPYVGEIIDNAFKSVQAVVVLLTGDDEVRLRSDLRKKHEPAYEKNLTPQPRPNVLFEAGLAFGHHPNNTVVVQIGRVRPFSDIAGRHVIHLDNSAEKRRDLAVRLSTAGCAVDTSGDDWLSEGDFA
jgi:predicted nucleotide-binding protein